MNGQKPNIVGHAKLGAKKTHQLQDIGGTSNKHDIQLHFKTLAKETKSHPQRGSDRMAQIRMHTGPQR